MSNFGSAFKENQYILSNQIMQVMLANDPSTLELTGLSEVYLNISEGVFKHLEENKDNKKFYLRFNSLAATICNNVILVSLREVGIYISKSRSSTSREKNVLSPIFHCEIFISSHRHLQKIC